MPRFLATGPPRTWWALAMVLVVAVCVGVACIVYTGQQQRREDHRWCELLTLQANPDPPPTTDRGRAQVREYRKLTDQFGCHEEGG